MLDSLVSQTCCDFELIIQDAGSDDGTLSILQNYENRFMMSVVSGIDTGIYDAWNKALSRIRGKWVIFLGADDMLVDPDTLDKCKATLSTLPKNILYVGGTVLVVSTQGDIVQCKEYDPIAAQKKIYCEMPFSHQGIFHRKEIFEKYIFNASLRIAGDYDFICRTWEFNNGNVVLQFPITRMRRGGISDQPQNVLRLRWENAITAAKYFPNTWTMFCIVGLIKGCLVWGLSKIFGSHSPAILDAIRILRGLPPVWKGMK